MAPSRNVAPRFGSVPLMGLLAICSGVGLLLALKQLGRGVRDGLGREAQFVLFAVGVLLVFWGVKQALFSLFPRLGGSTSVPRNRYRVSLPREGLVFLGIMAVMFVGSLLGRSNMLMLVFVMMAGPWVLNGWIAFMLTKGNRVVRRAPARAMAGQLVSVELTLENGKFWLSSWVMAARDLISSPQEHLEATVLYARVPPRSRRTAYYQFRLMNRGLYQFGPIEVCTRFPLGLVERGMSFSAPGQVLIHPRVGRLATHWKQHHVLSAELVQQQVSRKGTYDDEFHGIREYRLGDDPRSIHWRTSARRTELMVREFHQSRDEHLIVLLDLWQSKYPRQSELERVELAVSLTATICFEHLKQSRDAGLKLVVQGTQLESWESQVGTGAVESMLDLLAIVQGGPAESVAALLRESVISCTGGTRVLFLTTRPSDAELRSQFRQLEEEDQSELLREMQVIVVDESILETSMYFDDTIGA